MRWPRRSHTPVFASQPSKMGSSNSKVVLVVSGAGAEQRHAERVFGMMSKGGGREARSSRGALAVREEEADGKKGGRVVRWSFEGDVPEAGEAPGRFADGVVVVCNAHGDASGDAALAASLRLARASAKEGAPVVVARATGGRTSGRTWTDLRRAAGVTDEEAKGGRVFEASRVDEEREMNGLDEAVEWLYASM